MGQGLIKTWRFNPIYVYSKIKSENYFKKNSDLPWLVEDANDFLNSNLDKSMSVLEFGSGRSTKFFAQRVKEVFSREHDKSWYSQVSEELKTLKNVEYNYYENLHDYADVSMLTDNFFDVVLVDGRNRGNCLLNSIPKLKKGGLLILDNSERYLEYQTTAPAKFVLPERSKEWEEAEKVLKNHFWKIKMTNYVTDTLLFFKR